VAASNARLMIALPAPEQRTAVLQLGFLPAPYTLRLMGKGLTEDLNADPGTWRLTLGGTDLF
jgi:hypothetical protein